MIVIKMQVAVPYIDADTEEDAQTQVLTHVGAGLHLVSLVLDPWEPVITQPLSRAPARVERWTTTATAYLRRENEGT